MPQPIIDVLKPKVKPATIHDVKTAGKVGDAAFQFFKKYGEFPKSTEQLEEFIRP